ncbi:DciA family protein [Granulosicoccaceae sp. 1_MG-2023]|nr:DciA family protein [Granulosicoccaceae sp. 1_MG-2023]
MKNLLNLVQQQANRKAQGDQRIRALLSRKLDSALFENVEFFNIEEEQLTVLTRSAAWTSRLRFFSNEMLAILREAGIRVRDIKFSVSVKPKPEELVRPVPPNERRISERSLELLDSIAGDMENNELRRSFEKLIANAAKKNRSS